MEQAGSAIGPATGLGRIADSARWRGVRVARRLSDHPRDRPGRDGGRLRGGPGVAGSPRRPQGLRALGADRPHDDRAVPARGQGRGAAAPHQHRARLRRRRARFLSVLRDAVHPGPGARRNLERAAPVAKGAGLASGIADRARGHRAGPAGHDSRPQPADWPVQEPCRRTPRRWIRDRLRIVRTCASTSPGRQ